MSGDSGHCNSNSYRDTMDWTYPCEEAEWKSRFQPRHCYTDDGLDEDQRLEQCYMGHIKEKGVMGFIDWLTHDRSGRFDYIFGPDAELIEKLADCKIVWDGKQYSVRYSAQKVPQAISEKEKVA